MDVLGRLAKPALVLIMLGLVGCAILSSLQGPKTFAFSHEFHVGDQEMSCEDCHYGGSDAPGMPTIDDCMLCHEDLDPEKPENRRIAKLFNEDGEYLALRASKLSEDILFMHDSHVDDYVDDCSACHGDIAKNRRIKKTDLVTMATCTSCHAKNGYEARDCSMCHDEIDTNWMPPGHLAQWDRYHGQVVRADEAGTVNDCSMCHQESTCVECHKATPPRDHNNHYRSRGHGVHAMINRDRCSVCHEPDGCDRCHRETEPRSHVGSYGAPLNRHCLGCHLPLGPASNGCTTCHKDAPSHFQTPPLPPNQAHNTSNDDQCRECHIPGRLRHPDNGDSCRYCHR